MELFSQIKQRYIEMAAVLFRSFSGGSGFLATDYLYESCCSHNEEHHHITYRCSRPIARNF
ncbi:hypothetical protein DERF_014255 [Dermatophagoides farinae]|uniref:Uncharacterized protein n=1 Tax=Dermatophagoides farinae TaxID=6954 RepID=A0A922KSN5_DERFA|nr:hypothetical protein DERF_014255 [Dermatophagoides farinae]